MGKPEIGPGRLGLAFADDGPATDRKINLRQGGLTFEMRRESHRIGMLGQEFAFGKDQVLRLDETDIVFPRQPQFLSTADQFACPPSVVGLDAVGQISR